MIQDLNIIESTLAAGSVKHSVYFQTRNKCLKMNPEAYIALSLLPWMKIGKTSKVPERADKKFLSNIDQIQDIFSTWDNTFSKISIDSSPAKNPFPVVKNTAIFFSAGVDSFYSLYKHLSEINYLIFIHGFDIRLHNSKLRKQVSKNIYEIANSYGKEVIEVETNLRNFSNEVVSWSFYHGSALVAIGHLLRKKIDKIFIPATHSYADILPWGSHPLIDPLWSSTNLTFIHDGCEATRVEKVAQIAKHDRCLNALRVCSLNPNEIYNCGKCEKCIRTMINLKINNKLDQCSTFKNSLNLRNVFRIEALDENTKAFVIENFESIKRKANNKNLLIALWWVLHKPNYVIKLRRWLSLIINKFTFLSRLKNALNSIFF